MAIDIDADEMREQRQDMLLLAQQKLDELNNRRTGGLHQHGGRGSLQRIHRTNYSSSSISINTNSHQYHRNNNIKNSAISSTLLSTLLYLAIMSYKLDDMKAALQEDDTQTYNEWSCLFNNLHSPEFHTQERIMQNTRVKSIFARKKLHKERASRLEGELVTTSSQLLQLQSQSNDTQHELSKAITNLQEERTVLVTKNEKQHKCQINDLTAKLHSLQTKLDISENKLQVEVDTKQQLMTDNNITINKLEQQVSQYQQEAITSNANLNASQSTIMDLKLQLQSSEETYNSYRTEKETMVNKLQHELMAVQSTNTILESKLDTSNESLKEVKQQLAKERDDKQSAVSNVATIIDTSLVSSMNELKDQCTNLTDMVSNGISKLNEGMSSSESNILDGISNNTNVVIMKDILSSSQNGLHDVLGSVKEQLDNISTTMTQQQQSNNEQCSMSVHDEEMVGVKEQLNDMSTTLIQQQNSNNTKLHEEILSVREQLNEVMLKIEQSSVGMEKLLVEKDDVMQQQQQQQQSNSSTPTLLHEEMVSMKEQLHDMTMKLEQSNTSIEQLLLTVTKKKNEVNCSSASVVEDMNNYDHASRNDESTNDVAANRSEEEDTRLSSAAASEMIDGIVSEAVSREAH